MVVECVVTGRRDDAGFQLANATATALNTEACRDVSCTATALNEFEWEEFYKTQVKTHGTEAKNVKDQVLIMVDGKIQPSLSSFVTWAKDEHGLSAPEADYNLLAAEALAKYLNNPDKIFTFFDVTVGEKSAGRIVFELYKSICPKTCENFAKLCTGEAGETEQGLELTYKTSVFHRVQNNGWLQGGDIITGAGDGGHSVFGKTFEDENFIVEHDSRGVLSMANSGPHTNASQFCISFRALPWMNRKYVAFGKVVSGGSALTTLEEVATANGRPAFTCSITNCGVL
eukprot:m.31099 g.31099  ORF g.31099 m.31099 type:complete len:286 (+) comp6892_c0_seq1:36-893(+)